MIMSQRLLLEVVQGPLMGQSYAVPANSTLLIGRLPECGLSIPQDLTVSRQHCRIEFRPPECRLVHLSQTGETRVNDVSVATADLRSGDDISFGAGNLLRVRIEESPAGTEATAPPGRVDHPTSKQFNRFTMSAASCGWNVYGSADPQPGFERLLEILGKSQPVQALIDFQRLGQPVPPELVEPQFLFSWLPPETQALISPMMVSLSASPIVVDVLRTGWGRDGIVCFGSKLKEAELLAHWRKAIGAEGDKPGQSMTVYYWPSLLNMMLTCQSAQQVEPLLSGLDWLFLEAPDSPGNWHLFADEKFASVLTSAGLAPAEPADPVLQGSRESAS
jgi:FHA domain-containing protein/uncharacterized protein DUF4123